jgi:flagellar basal body-associated protein FliL
MKKELIIGLIIVVLMVGVYFIFPNKSSVSEPMSISDCEKLESIDYRDACFCNLATEKKDFSIIERISAEQKQEACYFAISIEKKPGPHPKSRTVIPSLMYGFNIF